MFERFARLLLLFCVVAIAFSNGRSSAAAGYSVGTGASALVARHAFLGAFFRAAGGPPFGVFSASSKKRAPSPYPTPGSKLFGPSGYCDAVAKNGVSISSGYVVDKTKLEEIVDLGVRWTRTGVEPFNDDTSHVFHHYSFGDFDSAQCALARHNIVATVAIDAGPVIYNAVDDQFSPKALPIYKTAADFGTWCGAVAQHETKTFTSVTRYTLPGNEVNSSPANFPGGDPQIAAYSEACYHAIKAVQPKAFVYGFELNMDARRDPVGFVKRLYDLGCKRGTCYDGLSIHLSLPYPFPPADAGCSEYGMGCIAEVQAAAHAPQLQIIIGETVYVVPAAVPDETVKAKAIVEEMKAFAADKYIDGVNYANVDECGDYRSGYFVGGCLVDLAGQKLPGYAALRALALSAYQ